MVGVCGIRGGGESDLSFATMLFMSTGWENIDRVDVDFVVEADADDPAEVDAGTADEDDEGACVPVLFVFPAAALRLFASFRARLNFRRWTLTKASNESRPSQMCCLLDLSCSLRDKSVNLCFQYRATEPYRLIISSVTSVARRNGITSMRCL